MIRLLTAVLLFASFDVAANDCDGFSPAPTKCDLNQLNNNEVADADKVMDNFNKLGDAVDALPTPPTNCTTDQIIKWDGTSDAWVCATDPFAGLNCDVGDQLRMGSGGWECRAEPITASLTENSWAGYGGDFEYVVELFDSVNNVEPDSICDGAYCFIKVIENLFKIDAG